MEQEGKIKGGGQEGESRKIQVRKKRGEKKVGGVYLFSLE